MHLAEVLDHILCVVFLSDLKCYLSAGDSPSFCLIPDDFWVPGDIYAIFYLASPLGLRGSLSLSCPNLNSICSHKLDHPIAPHASKWLSVPWAY